MDKLSVENVKQMQPLVLAQIGDAVQTLFVREYVARKWGVKVNKMNRLVSSVVCAGSQFNTFKLIESELLEDEQDIANRARNTHIHSKAKNFSYTQYIYATALEALIGYLYLTEKQDRLKTVLELSLKNIDLEILNKK